MLAGFHPSVRSWFEARYGTPTEPQALGWPCIQRGEDTLIAAPTGSGKTLAAFLACLDAMIHAGEALRDETQVLYVSPLKALANDVQMNLLEPLAELRRMPGVPEIRAAVRTGDTPQAERQAMLRKPPHVLVTTPESFYLLLTSEGGRKTLRTVRTVIVDEIHAVARDKRGAHRRPQSASSRSSERARWAPRLSRATAWISSTITVRTVRRVLRPPSLVSSR